MQTRPQSVQDLIIIAMRNADYFTSQNYDGKTFDESIREIISLEREVRDTQIILLLQKFCIWCQSDHPDITYTSKRKNQYHKAKRPRSILTYASRLRDVLEYVYGIEITVRNFKKKLRIPDPSEFDPEPLSKETVRMICDYTKSEEKTLYMTMKDSGMRIGEAVAIRKKHIDITKNPIEIHIPASITKTNRTRITYVTRETNQMLINHLKRLDNDQLVFGKNENQTKAVDRAGQDFWRLRDELAKIDPKFNETYEENGIHKVTLHSFRSYTATQCAEAVDEGFGHGIIGHKKYLGQYIRNQNKMPELYKRAEPYLMIYEKIEVVDQSSELSELKREVEQNKREFQELLKLQEMKRGLEIEIETQKRERC
jgi:integrase